MTSKRRAYFAWVVVCVVWGTTYLAIRIALESIPPLLMAAMRWIAAGSILLAALKIRGEQLPGRRAWPALAILGILLLGLGNGAVVWAEQTVASGLTAVLVATVPFWMVGIEAIVERRARRNDQVPAQSTSSGDGSSRLVCHMIGLMIGFAGIVMLVWPELRTDENRHGFLVGFVSTQIACVGWAVGSSYARHRGRNEAESENVLATAAYEMLFGGLALLLVSAFLREPARLAFTLRTSLALGHLIIFGAIAGFTAYAYALKHLSVATVSLYAYINPVIAVVLGALVLGEPFGVRMAVAAAVVFTGVALVRD
ncbi:MAG TPA: EamA family transporter [Vicinamibacterales bacterium]|jgi:drug/metabolite transporter (DMT)-like permease